MHRTSLSLPLVLCSAALILQCDPGDTTGTAQVAYRLQMPNGAPLTCEEAGVGLIEISLFTNRDDAAVTARASAQCEVDGEGNGVARVSLPTGFYESSFVSMRTADGSAVSLLTGALASWEYVAVEISDGGLTEYVPGVVGTFRGNPVCGNGRLETGEECDDGNAVSGDGCSDTCQEEVIEDRTIHIEWTPTRDGSEITCASMSAATVDITVYEAGTTTPVVMVSDLTCSDRSYAFSNMDWGSYDVVLTGLGGGVVEVADGTALGVDHASPGPTTVQVALEAR